jgi:hypothetical protein
MNLFSLYIPDGALPEIWHLHHRRVGFMQRRRGLLSDMARRRPKDSQHPTAGRRAVNMTKVIERWDHAHERIHSDGLCPTPST